MFDQEINQFDRLRRYVVKTRFPIKVQFLGLVLTVYMLDWAYDFVSEEETSGYRRNILPSQRAWNKREDKPKYVTMTPPRAGQNVYILEDDKIDYYPQGIDTLKIHGYLSKQGRSWTLTPTVQ